MVTSRGRLGRRLRNYEDDDEGWATRTLTNYQANYHDDNEDDDNDGNEACTATAEDDD